MYSTWRQKANSCRSCLQWDVSSKKNHFFVTLAFILLFFFCVAPSLATQDVQFVKIYVPLFGRGPRSLATVLIQTPFLGDWSSRVQHGENPHVQSVKQIIHRWGIFSFYVVIKRGYCEKFRKCRMLRNLRATDKEVQHVKGQLHPVTTRESAESWSTIILLSKSYYISWLSWFYHDSIMTIMNITSSRQSGHFGVSEFPQPDAGLRRSSGSATEYTLWLWLTVCHGKSPCY